MASFQNIKKQILPLIKGLPLILAIFLVSLFIARKIIQYTEPTYVSVAKIKLDNQKYGFSNSLLYEDFDIFTSKDKIETEAELLSSHLLIKKALKKVNFSTAIYRKGKIKTTSLYENNPINIKHSLVDDQLLDIMFTLTVNENNLLLEYQGRTGAQKIKGTLNIPFNIDGNEILITKNDSLIRTKKLQLNGDYVFTFYSEEGLINKIKSKLDVKAIDKEMSVLRVVFKDEIPARTAAFNNALCETYIEDYINTKSYAANKTVQFIDNKLNKVGQDLSKAELALERYKQRNDVVNTRQETETGLLEISNLKILLINLEMSERSIEELEEYMRKGDYFDETAINFGFGDLLMTELVKKLKLWRDEKQDLLMKYTEESDEIKTVNNKINEVKWYIKEAIQSNKREIITKRAQLEAKLNILSKQFEDIPSREKDIQILEREFHLQQSVFNFLSEKRIEASIVSSSSTAFHRIIQKAYPPKKPISPNKTLITFVCGLMGLIIGISFVYLKKLTKGKVIDKEDLERNSLLPIAGIVRHCKFENEKEFQPLIKSLLLKELIKPKNIICITSGLNNEGKTVLVKQSAQVLMNMGYTVCLIDYDVFNQGLSDTNNPHLFLKNHKNLENGTILSAANDAEKLAQKPELLSDKIKELKAKFDFIIIDTSPCAITIEPIEVMKMADITLYAIRSNHTAINQISHADFVAEEFKVENVNLVLTDAHKASNYSGNQVGTRFKYGRKNASFITHIKRYFEYYMK